MKTVNGWMVGVVVMAGMMAACQPEAEALPVREIVLASPEGTASKTLRVEVAETDETRTKGLMFRTQLAEGTGMLFVWPEAGVRKFWMRNTLIPLDMLFFKDGRMVGKVVWAKPHDETPVGPDAQVDTVLEVPAGYSDKHGIADGWTLTKR